MARIFISRKIAEDTDWVIEARQQGHHVFGYSCIQTSTVKISTLGEFDWVFFSSSEGVHHFLRQFNVGNAKIGAMGIGTALTLDNHNVKADFIGQNSAPEKVAHDFQKVLLPQSKILFPQSEQTRNSIAPLLTDCHIERVTAYRTGNVQVAIADASIFIFSSPSNVKSYLSQHALPFNAQCIAFGPTTAQALKDSGARNIHTLENVHHKEIMNAIKLSLSGLEGTM